MCCAPGRLISQKIREPAAWLPLDTLCSHWQWHTRQCHWVPLCSQSPQSPLVAVNADFFEFTLILGDASRSGCAHGEHAAHTQMAHTVTRPAGHAMCASACRADADTSESHTTLAGARRTSAHLRLPARAPSSPMFTPPRRPPPRACGMPRATPEDVRAARRALSTPRPRGAPRTPLGGCRDACPPRSGRRRAG